MSAVMKDIERQVGGKLYEIVGQCQEKLSQVRSMVEDAADSPLVGNGVQKALTEYIAEIDKISKRHEGMYNIIRERFGMPETEVRDDG